MARDAVRAPDCGDRRHFLSLTPGSVPPARADGAFVTNQGSDNLTVVDLETMKPVATIAVGGKPAGVAVTGDGARAYVTNPEGKDLSVIDARDRRVLRRIPLEGGPLGLAVAPDGQRVYVADMYDGRLYAVDPDRGVVATAVLDVTPSGVAVTPDGQSIVVALERCQQNRIRRCVVARQDRRDRRRPASVRHDDRRRRQSRLRRQRRIRRCERDRSRRSSHRRDGEGRQAPLCLTRARGRAFVTNQYAST